MRKALLFCFNLKKSAAESHRMLVEVFGDNVLSETTSRNWFRWFNDDNFELSDKKRENPGRLRTINCRLFWTKTIPNRKKCLQNAEQLGVSQAAISMRLHGEGSKDRKMGAA